MSASPQKNATERRINAEIEQHKAMLATGHRLGLDDIRYYQGIIAGLNIAMDHGEEAYKELGA